MTTDILFSFDTTGSMRNAIAEVRRNVTKSATELFGNIKDLRIAVVSHGDSCDGARGIDILDFTSDEKKVIQFINTTPDTGGGDDDEWYEYVLYKCKSLSWRDGQKRLVMIGDANPHRIGYTNNGYTCRHDWKAMASELALMGVSIYAVQALGRSSSKMFYQELAGYGNGYRIDLSQFSDVTQTLMAISYHKTDMFETYKNKLETGFQMNRSLAKMFESLGSKPVASVFTKSDSSGLIPVSPSRFIYLTVDAPCAIKQFVESRGVDYKIGRGFYQLSKSETIQENKEVVIRHKITKDMFTGDKAREFLGIPYGERGRVRPDKFDEYDFFIQSTSVNRKLMAGTDFLYEQ